MKLDFIFTVNPYVLAYLLLRNDIDYEDDIHQVRSIQSEFKEKHHKIYSMARSKLTFPEFNNALTRRQIDIFEGLIETDIMAKLYDDAMKHKEFMETNWQQHKDQVNKNLSDILRIKTKPETNIIVVSPQMQEISYTPVPFNPYIFIGRYDQEDNPQANISYLVFEYLQTLYNPIIGKNYRNRETIQAIMAVIAFRELPKRLYGDRNFDFSASAEFKDRCDAIQPLFDKYLEDDNQNIYQFVNNIFQNNEITNMSGSNHQPKQKIKEQ